MQTEASLAYQQYVYNPDKIQGFRDGSRLVIRSSTWALNPKAPKSTFKEKFQRNPRTAMRDFASIPVSSLEAFVKDPTIIDRKLNVNRVPPFTMEKQPGGGEKMVFHPDFKPGPYTYFFHGDLGIKRDAAGLAMSHLDTRRNMVVVDFMMTIKALPGQEIRFERFRQIIYSLAERGFEFGKVTFDTWQSFETKQHLESRGYNVEFFSVDRDTKAYDTGYELMLMGRLDYYYNEVFFREFRELQLIEGKKVDHPEGGCFVGETKVDLLDRKGVSLEQLYKEGKEVWVYASRSDGSIVPAKAKPVFAGKYSKMVRVTLDSGAAEVCTDYHLWRKRDGSYERADSLKPGDSLMPLYRRERSLGGKRTHLLYEQVFDQSCGKWVWTHRLVAESVYGLQKKHVHHKNGKRTDNRPENLEFLSPEEHAFVHNRGPLGGATSNRAQAVAAWNARPEVKKAQSERATRMLEGNRAIGLWERVAKRMSEFQRRLDVKVKRAGWLKTYRRSEAFLEAQRKYREKRFGTYLGDKVKLSAALKKGWETRKKRAALAGLAPINHKVISVEVLNEEREIYCLEVPGECNFALSSGVYVHNSKDLCDAVFASVFYALKEGGGVDQFMEFVSISPHTPQGAMSMDTLIGSAGTAGGESEDENGSDLGAFEFFMPR